MEGKQAEAEPENQVNETHVDKEEKRPSTESEFRLPKLFVRTVDGHDCERTRCKPGITDERLKEAIEYVKQERLAEFIEKCKAEIRARVEPEVRAEKKYSDQIMDKVFQDI
ncbi:MAG: hypothetical protein Q9207_003923 [Kuettlingeria erythrocarpa]